MDFTKKEIIGMIHLAGPDTIEKAMDEIKIYEEEGLSGIIIENYHGGVEDVIRVLERLKYEPTKLCVGINILPNEYKVAYEICDMYPQIQFIQLDYVSGNYDRTEKSINIDELLILWDNHSTVKLFGGVWPKYYTPIEGSVLEDDIMGGLLVADAIVVTGTATGMETPLDKVKTFRTLMDGDRTDKFQGYKRPLIIGAGLTPLNVRDQLVYAQGAIVGSAFKPNGRTNQMVDRDLVRVFMDEVRKIKY